MFGRKSTVITVTVLGILIYVIAQSLSRLQERDIDADHDATANSTSLSSRRSSPSTRSATAKSDRNITDEKLQGLVLNNESRFSPRIRTVIEALNIDEHQRSTLQKEYDFRGTQTTVIEIEPMSEESAKRFVELCSDLRDLPTTGRDGTPTTWNERLLDEYQVGSDLPFIVSLGYDKSGGKLRYGIMLVDAEGKVTSSWGKTFSFEDREKRTEGWRLSHLIDFVE